MALRCFLVGLVACFGFEIPTPSELSNWSVPAQNWVTARTIGVAALRVEATDWLRSPVAPLPVAADLAPPSVPTAVPAGRATCAEERGPIGSGVATDDPIGRGTPGKAATIDEEFEALTTAMVDQFGAEGRALAANEDRPALEVDGDSPGPVASPGEANRLVLLAPTSAEPASLVDEEVQDLSRPAATERLSSAVRLTQEAVQAWAALARAIGSDEHLLR